MIEIKEPIVNIDTGEITTPEEFYVRLMRLLLKYKDSYSRKKYGKKYNSIRKEYHFSSGGEVVIKDVPLEDKTDVLWKDEVVGKVIDHITGEIPEKNITSVLRDWNKRGL